MLRYRGFSMEGLFEDTAQAENAASTCTGCCGLFASSAASCISSGEKVVFLLSYSPLSHFHSLSLSHAACSAVKVRRRPTSLRLSIGGRRVQIRSVSLGTAQAKAVAIQCSFEALSRPVVQTICHIRSTLNPMRFSQIFFLLRARSWSF